MGEKEITSLGGEQVSKWLKLTGRVEEEVDGCQGVWAASCRRGEPCKASGLRKAKQTQKESQCFVVVVSVSAPQSTMVSRCASERGE